MQQARHGVREAAAATDARVHFFLEHEPYQPREHEGAAHRRREHQEIADRDAQGAPPELRAHDRAGQIHRGTTQAEVSQREHHPGAKSDQVEHAADPSLDEASMASRHDEVGQRTPLQSDGDQARGHPNADVDDQREIAAAEDARTEEQACARISRGGRGQRRREHDQQGACGEADVARRPAREDPPGQDADGRQHLDEEDQLLQ